MGVDYADDPDAAEVHPVARGRIVAGSPRQAADELAEPREAMRSADSRALGTATIADGATAAAVTR